MARISAIVLALGCLCAVFAPAQDNKSMGKPAKYVWYENAKMNTGKEQVYSKIVAQFRDAAATTAPDVYWIAGSPITGDSDRVTFVTFHDSMASVEKTLAAFDKIDQAISMKNASLSAEAAESDGGSHWVLAEYRDNLSYRPDVVPQANTMWWATTLINLRPGCTDDFNNVVKQVIDLHKKVNDNDHWLTYSIRAGYPEPSVLFVTPMKSLAEEDEETPAAAKELFESAPVRQMFNRIEKECIQHIESTYTKVDPTMSRPPQSLIAANPDFWTIKPETPAAATKGKPAKMKKTPVEPAALKEKENPK
jgi:hypothetical protein